MAVQQQKIRILSSAERAEEARKFVLPNPGDVMISLVFIWALFCFFLVTAGDRLLMRVARLAQGDIVKDAIAAADATALTTMMVVGCVGLIAIVIVCYNYKKVVIGALLIGLTFGSCTWPPLHNLAFAVKYAAIIFMAAFGGLFFYKNFWRMLNAPFYRLLLLYFVWVFIIQITLGGKTDDFWYIGTDIAFIFGFSFAYLYYIDDTEKLLEYNKVLAYTALIILCLHALAPISGEQFTQAGRFQSMFNRATGFAVFFAPVVVLLFWMGMREKNNVLRQVFTVAAIIALVFILWSGTRSAILGIVAAVGILWWVFRTRIFVYIFLAATLGLVAQILGTSSGDDFQNLINRFEGGNDDLESGSGRFDIWKRYYEVWVGSPIYGYSMSGVKRQLLASGVAKALEAMGLVLKTTAPHNAYIGMAARFGVIGLIVLLTPIFFALRRGRQVILNLQVPAHEKQVYVLPVALVVVTCITSFFEDAIGAQGKGTVSAFLLYPALIFCEVHGRRLMEQYPADMPGVGAAAESGVTKPAAVPEKA